MGFMNVFLPFIGGVSMCHGAGDFASQYFWRENRRAMIMEGLIEIFALFLSDSITTVFKVFQYQYWYNASLCKLKTWKIMVKLRGLVLIEVLTIGATSFFTNLAVGFLAGVILHYFINRMTVYRVK